MATQKPVKEVKKTKAQLKVDAEKAKATQKAYYDTYYAENKVAISNRRKARYNSDAKYREKAQSRAMERHIEMKTQRQKSSPASSDPLSHGARGYNKPRVMTIGGKPVLVRGVAEFADRIGRDVQTITVWEQNKVIPPPTGKDELNRRWYSDNHIEFIRGMVMDFQASGSRRLAEFRAMVLKKWVSLGGSAY